MKSTAVLIALFTSLGILCTASQCHDDSLSTGEEIQTCKDGKLPTWIDGIISSTEQNGNKGEIIQYRYQGKTVFWVNDCLDCADTMTQVYDCQQNVICRFGGIAGFNTCPDFSQKATHKKIIWQN